jgi:uncharacterized membrane protein YhfC
MSVSAVIIAVTLTVAICMVAAGPSSRLHQAKDHVRKAKPIQIKRKNLFLFPFFRVKNTLFLQKVLTHAALIWVVTILEATFGAYLTGKLENFWKNFAKFAKKNSTESKSCLLLFSDRLILCPTADYKTN